MAEDKSGRWDDLIITVLILIAFVLGIALSGVSRDEQISNKNNQIGALTSNLASCKASVATCQEMLSTESAISCPLQDCYAKSYSDLEAKCRYKEQCRWYGFVESNLCDRSCGTGMHVKNVICEPN
jgi:hypothetical protein